MSVGNLTRDRKAGFWGRSGVGDLEYLVFQTLNREYDITNPLFTLMQIFLL